MKLSKKQKQKIEAIKADAHKVVTLDSLPFPSILWNYANAHLRYNGFYSYVNSKTNEKIFVQS